MYYVLLLQNIVKGKWEEIYNHFKLIRQPRLFENTNIDAKGNTVRKIRSTEQMTKNGKEKHY